MMPRRCSPQGHHERHSSTLADALGQFPVGMVSDDRSLRLELRLRTLLCLGNARLLVFRQVRDNASCIDRRAIMRERETRRPILNQRRLDFWGAFEGKTLPKPNGNIDKGTLEQLASRPDHIPCAVMKPAAIVQHL